MLLHIRVLGVDLLEVTLVTDDAEVDDAVQGMGSVESLHVAEGEPLGEEAGFTRR